MQAVKPKQPDLIDGNGCTFYGRAEQTDGGVWFYRDGTKLIPLRLKTIPAQPEGAY